MSKLLIDEPLPGVKIFRPVHVAEDSRGEFVKCLTRESLDSLGIWFELVEEFFSVSDRGVVRGMHLQTPPLANRRIIQCISGSVIDVVLDLRPGSSTIGQFAAFELTAENRHSVYLPAGVAHGFAAMEDGSIVLYKSDKAYVPQHDQGVRWDSFGYDWPVTDPVISDRDRGLPPLAEFHNPMR